MASQELQVRYRQLTCGCPLKTTKSTGRHCCLWCLVTSDEVRYRQLTCGCPLKTTKSTGRHCCLWCLVTSDELKSPPNSVACRSVEGILTDFSNSIIFIAQGSHFSRDFLHNSHPFVIFDTTRTTYNTGHVLSPVRAHGRKGP